LRESPFEVRRRFRSQPFLWLLPIVGILVAIWSPAALHEFGPPDPKRVPTPLMDRAFGITFGAVLVWGFLRMHEVFFVGPEGVERRRFFRRESWTWDEMAGLSGRRVEDKSRYGDWTGSTTTYVANDIRDADGEVLFRLGPWIQKRRKLATLIRRGIAEAGARASRSR
jgi:hypothetical protein